MMSLGDTAAKLGLPVFPCGDNKQPVIETGFKAASSDRATILEAFRRNGATLIGMPTGQASGLIAIDIDIRDDRSGMDWLNENSGALPETRTHKTRSGGLHLIFRAPAGVEIRNSAGKVAPGVDVRGSGGYVILPPSPGYQVADPTEPAEMPRWLIRACLPPEPAPVQSAPRAAPRQDGGSAYGLKALSDECDAVRSAPFGQQEHTINAAGLKIGALVAGGELNEGIAMADLLAAGRGVASMGGREPWKPGEIDAKLRRAFEDGKGSPRKAPARPERHDEMPPEPDPDDPGPQPAEHGPRRTRRDEGGAILWGDPVDFLSDGDLGTPELQPHHVPDAIWPFVTDVAVRMGVDPFGVALGALVCCASVISDRWRLQPQRHNYRWTESARLWAGILGGPSTIKTPQISACTRPIEKLDAEARHRHTDDMRTYQAALADHKKAVKAGEESDEPRLPKLDRFLVEGTTVEALQEVLRDDEGAKQRAPAGKVLSRHDEMSEWFASLDRYKAGGSGGGDRGSYLRLYNGGRYTLDRVGRGSFAVSNWSACFLGGCQPGPIQRIAREAADDGLLQRFMWCVSSRREPGVDQRPDHAAELRYEALFPALLALMPAAEHGSDHIPPVVLHADGHVIREEIEAIARAMTSMPDASPRLQSTFGKWPGLFGRLLLTFHLINHAEARHQNVLLPPLNVVPVATIERVSAFMLDVVLPHLLRAEAVMFSTNQTGHARWIAGLILAKPFQRITTRDITRAYSALRPPEASRELADVMSSLVTMGWLEPEESANQAKPTHAWLVNPAVHTVFAARAEKERVAREEARDLAATDIRTLLKKRKSKEVSL